MRFQKSFQKLCAAVTASAMLFSFAALSPALEADAADAVTVNLSKTYQTIRGFGGIDLPEWTGGALTTAQRQTAFGNGDNELGLTILRVYVSDNRNDWKNALPTAKDVIARGGKVFATPWNPPKELCETFTRTYKDWKGDTIIQENQKRLRHDKYAEYAQHLNDFVHFMKDNGVPLSSISVQNEPDYGEDWTWWTSDECMDFILNYRDKIDCPLMSPETFQYNKEYYNKILNNPTAFKNVDVFGTHFYGTQRNQMDFPALENCGKELWMTEVYVPDSKIDGDAFPDSLDLPENIHNGMVVGNLNAYVYWYIRRSYGPIKENGNISKRGYCMAQFSKYVRPGSVRVEATEHPMNDVSVSAYLADGQVTIVAINKSDTGYAQDFVVSDAKILNVDRYRTSANENLAPTKSLDFTDSHFFAQLPAKSVSTFVVKVDGVTVPKDDPTTPSNPTTPQQPDAKGEYYHETFEEGKEYAWDARGGSKLSFSGRMPYAGTNALLVSERTASWNGAAKTLDTNTFQLGKAYSFSTNVAYADGPATQKFFMKLQYTDAAGKAHYETIAEATAIRGEWVQLANTSYTIPADAVNPSLYIETEKDSYNFYLDEAVGAVENTKIDGPAEQPFLLGDVNQDGVINVFDLAMAKSGVVRGFKGNVPAVAADVDQSGAAKLNDLIAIQKYIVHQITDFDADITKPSTPSDPTNPDTPSTPSNPSTSLSMAEFTSQCAAKLIEKEPESTWKELAGKQYGTIEKGTYYSTTCKRNKPYNILLPAGYDSSKQYPVLYVMHGYWEDQDRMILTGNNPPIPTRQIIGNAIADGEAKDMIVVFPYIYSSATQDACSAMDDANNAAYDNFINDLTKDLMPHIESTYSVKTGRDNTAITGFSMGGREALLIGMQRSDLFGYVGAICPAPGVTGAFQWDSGKEPYLLMITAGSDDTVVYNNPENYHNSFTKNNVPHIWHYVDGGYHGDNCIRAHLYNFCRYVFQATN